VAVYAAQSRLIAEATDILGGAPVLAKLTLLCLLLTLMVTVVVALTVRHPPKSAAPGRAGERDSWPKVWP
jgi:hypothetical protein